MNLRVKAKAEKRAMRVEEKGGMCVEVSFGGGEVRGGSLSRLDYGLGIELKLGREHRLCHISIAI